ncbi:TonB-dependent siderophore receptor [Comamonas serinivorans]|uniref:TonB-dependent siderophore receptor n=1 Tax=Comamonas serinivorans TaxID=1082851 RepID=A0A1Y0ER50_9BURK|nr:TonB-dependent receptor [Comamonas serinivorans]ARU05978.1 TonB-dependent siderophore receptor [Comamonas serinivorans]
MTQATPAARAVRPVLRPAHALRPSPLLASWMLCCPLLATAQDTLPSVQVTADAVPSALQTPATSGTHLPVTTQDLPASLSAITARQAEERADFGVADAVTRTVGLTSTASPGNGGMAFSSRGFSGVNSVGVAEDGLSLPVAAGTITYPNAAWGYERFEVLRGPGSLMFGSGTMGATVNAIRKTPSADRQTEMLLGGGQHGTARAGLGTTGALAPGLSYRIDAYGERTDGERPLGRSTNAKLMNALRWQASDTLRFDLTADFSDTQPERYFGTPTVDGRVARALRHQNYNVRDSDIRYLDRRVKFKGEWQVRPGLTLRNESYHFSSDRHWKNIEAYGYNPAQQTVARSDYLEIGHDLTQSGNRLALLAEAGQHKLAAGWDLSRSRFKALNSSPYTGSSVVDALNPQHGVWDSPDPYALKLSNAIRQNALYLEDAWQLHDQWLLMAGLRRDWYDFDRRDVVSQATLAKKLAGTSWRLGLTHTLNDRTNVYAQVSTGHDPVTSLLSLAASQSGFTLSRGRQVELGIKQQLPDPRGEWALAVYDIRKDDIITRDPLQPTVSIQGGSQSSRGIELSGALQASRAWRFEGNLGWVDAQFDELREGATGIDRSGNRPANVPRVTANVWAHYTVGDWRASLGLRHVGKRYSSNANTTYLPSYVVADAVVSWRMNRQVSFNLVGRNLANRLYAQSSYGSQWLLGRGRQVELNAQLRF